MSHSIKWRFKVRGGAKKKEKEEYPKGDKQEYPKGDNLEKMEGPD